MHQNDIEVNPFDKYCIKNVCGWILLSMSLTHQSQKCQNKLNKNINTHFLNFNKLLKGPNNIYDIYIYIYTPTIFDYCLFNISINIHPFLIKYKNNSTLKLILKCFEMFEFVVSSFQ